MDKIVVQVIGDCHTARIAGQHVNAHLGPIEELTRFNPPLEVKNSKFLKDTNIEVNFWGLAGFKCFGIDLPETLIQDPFSSNVEDAWDIPGVVDNVELKFKFSQVLKADIIMPWLGYVDCRNWIPKYKNADLVAKDYVDSFIQTFPNKKFRFIDPFPQFQELNTHNYPSIAYDLKIKADNEFRDALSKICKDKGFLPPITQDIVYDAVGERTLHKAHARIGNEEYHKSTTIDALKFEYNEKVYNNLVDQIKETVNLLS